MCLLAGSLVAYLFWYLVTTFAVASHPLQAGDLGVPSTIGPGAGLPCQRLSAHGRLWTANPEVSWAMGLSRTTLQQQYVWWLTDRLLLLHGSTSLERPCLLNSATLDRQSKHFVNIWKLYFFYNMRLRRICDSLIFFAPFIQCSYLLILMTAGLADGTCDTKLPFPVTF